MKSAIAIVVSCYFYTIALREYSNSIGFALPLINLVRLIITLPRIFLIIFPCISFDIFNSFLKTLCSYFVAMGKTFV